MFRIGVHLGEVIVDYEDRNIFGCGVNLAERIQGLAEPRGIAVSRTSATARSLRP
jgi:adenylate cyclase